MHERPLGAPADGARDVRERRRARAARQDEFLQWPEIGIERLDGVFEARNMSVGDCVMPGHRQLAAQVEQIVLRIGEARDDRRRQRLGQQQPDRRIELVDLADRRDTRGILRDA